MSKLRIVLSFFAMCVLTLVMGAGCMSGLTETPQTFIVGKEFIEDLAAGDYDAATSLAASELQNPESRAALEALVSENTDLLNSNTEVHLTGRGISNNIRYAYGTISSGDTESPLYMEFLDEDGKTVVSYFSFNAEDIEQATNYSD